MDQFVGPSFASNQAISSLSSTFNISGMDTFSWKKIWDLTSLPEFLNFENTVYSGCANGSIMAIHSPTGARNCLSNAISVHDMKYNLLYRYIVDVRCDRIFFHVTNSDHLIVLTNRGELITFFSGYKKSQYNIFYSVNENLMIDVDEIIAADFWDNGVVFMTNNKIYYSAFFKFPPKVLFTFSEGSQIVRDFKVIPSEYTEDNLPIVYFTNYTSILTIIASQDIFHIDLENEIISFSFSQDYSMISFMCEHNILIITNSSLDKTFYQVVIQDLNNFVQIAWIGNVAPAIAFLDEIVVVGRTEVSENDDPHYGDLISIDQLMCPFSGKTHLFSSYDSVFVLSNFSLFKLSYVSDELQCASNSIPIHPVSILIDAFIKRSSSKVLKLRSDSEKLSEAVKNCIKISKELEFPEGQKLALFSAAYGKNYILPTSPFYEELVCETSEFEKITRYLRVCNAFNQEMNMVVTYNECSQLSVSDILMRFCNRHLFSLAVEVADYFSADKSSVMTEWCCSMANTIKSDDVALRIIEKKRDDSFNLNSIALALFELGRKDLAKSVAEKLESIPEKVVPFYVKCGFWEKAFNAASISCNTPLIIEVLNKALSKVNAVDKGCKYELITEAISKNYVIAKTVFKLFDSNKSNTKLAILLQNTPTSQNTVEIQILRLLKDFIISVHMRTSSDSTLFENFLLMKRTIKQMISKYNVNWVNSVYFALKQNLSVFRAEDDLRSYKGDGKQYLFAPFNSIFDKMIEVGDFTTAMKLVRDVNLNEKRYFVRIAQVLVSNNNSFYRFKELTEVTYKDCWTHFLLILFFKKGINEAAAFARDVKNPKKSSELLALLNQNDFPQCAFSAKLTLKVFSDKFF